MEGKTRARFHIVRNYQSYNSYNRAAMSARYRDVSHARPLYFSVFSDPLGMHRQVRS